MNRQACSVLFLPKFLTSICSPWERGRKEVTATRTKVKTSLFGGSIKHTTWYKADTSPFPCSLWAGSRWSPDHFKFWIGTHWPRSYCTSGCRVDTRPLDTWFAQDGEEGQAGGEWQGCRTCWLMRSTRRHFLLVLECESFKPYLFLSGFYESYCDGASSWSGCQQWTHNQRLPQQT